jgi:hypothetical protein
MRVNALLSPRVVRALLDPTRVAVVARACRRAVAPARSIPSSLDMSLTAAYRWLCAAQDANRDGGVAGCYNLAHGWSASYPETTGYIIPTFLHYSTARDEPAARDRALRMADWEVEVQLPTGAVRSGMMTTKVGPAVFNSGQVLFGWVAAHGATHDDRYAGAAARAAQWLTSVQDDDGAWRRHLSLLTTSTVQTYNVRTAFGLAMAGARFDERRWTDAAIANCDWALRQQQSNGWFASNAFSDQADPLLHTIGYVLEGVLGVGELVRREAYIDAVVRGVGPLVDAYGRDGVLKGRYDRAWRPSVSWRCLTGEAQVALVMLRLARLTDESKYTTTATSLLKGLSSLQDLRSTHSESHGAIAGSHPLWGGYGPFNYLNWAAKFFMDALLLHLHTVDVQRLPEQSAETSPAPKAGFAIRGASAS